MTVAIVAILTTVIGLAITACALPVVIYLERLWVNVYTRLAPASARQGRRRDIEAEHHDQIEEGRTLGYRPSEIAIYIGWRWLSGVPDDLMWGVREGLAAREDRHIQRVWADSEAATMTLTREGQTPIVAKAILRRIGIARRNLYVFYASRRDRNGHYRVATVTQVGPTRLGRWCRHFTELIRRRILDWK